MITIRDRVERIRAYAQAQGWKPHRLATAAGLAIGTCQRMHDPDWNPRLETLEKLEALVPPDFDPETAQLAEASR